MELLVKMANWTSDHYEVQNLCKIGQHKGKHRLNRVLCGTSIDACSLKLALLPSCLRSLINIQTPIHFPCTGLYYVFCGTEY